MLKPVVLHTVIVFALVTVFLPSYAQETSPVISGKLLSKINVHTKGMNNRLQKQMEKYLLRLEKEEKRLIKEVVRHDSSVAKMLANDSSNSYSALLKQIRHGETVTTRKGSEYISSLDSITTSLKFLDQHKKLLPSPEAKRQIESSIKKYGDLQKKLQNADGIKEYVSERKRQIKESLTNIKKLPKGLSRNLDRYNKQAYYYTAQIREYKNILNNSAKAEQQVLKLINRVPAFNDFMRKNSFLSQLFPQPSDASAQNSVNLSGLQTRVVLQQEMQQQFGSASSLNQSVNQGMQTAQEELRLLKDKINKAGGNSSDMEMPDFKPNQQKTKSFLNRLEYGTTIQSQRSNRLLPVSSEIGLTVQYKLNSKSAIGLGIGYKMGWGQSIRKMRITHEGINIRSFVESKLKGSFYITGGYERNYMASFKRIEELKNAELWSNSGLVGISKKYKINNKFKGNLQLMWDFLSYSQIPRTPAFVYRLGYNF
jgi:hypothetical protein